MRAVEALSIRIKDIDFSNPAKLFVIWLYQQDYKKLKEDSN